MGIILNSNSSDTEEAAQGAHSADIPDPAGSQGSAAIAPARSSAEKSESRLRVPSSTCIIYY